MKRYIVYARFGTRILLFNGFLPGRVVWLEGSAQLVKLEELEETLTDARKLSSFTSIRSYEINIPVEA